MGSSTNGVSPVLWGWHNPLIPQLKGKGMMLCSTWDICTQYGPGGNQSLLQGPALLTLPNLSHPGSQSSGGNWSQHSTQQESSMTNSGYLLWLSSCGEKLLSVPGHKDGERANPSLPVHCQPCAAGAVHLGQSCDSP